MSAVSAAAALRLELAPKCLRRRPCLEPPVAVVVSNRAGPVFQEALGELDDMGPYVLRG